MADKKNETKLNRVRALKIWEILQSETDEFNPMGTTELCRRLEEQGISSHRSTIYEDIEVLGESGYEILTKRGRSNEYYVMDRKFSSPEIHLLMDAVQAAAFITDKKTAELIDKIAQLAGSRKGEVLKNNIVHFNTANSTNESIYYSIDTIIDAINHKKKIIFLYFDYDIHHKRVYRKEGHHYVVSPVATIFDDGHYYLIVYDKRFNKMTNYRIDRMDKVEEIEEDADKLPKGMKFDAASFKKSMFGMFSGETTAVTIEAEKSLLDVIFDLFGSDVRILPSGGDRVRFTVDVQVSPLFFGWCCSFGDKVRLLGPGNIVSELREYMGNVLKQYEK